MKCSRSLGGRSLVPCLVLSCSVPSGESYERRLHPNPNEVTTALDQIIDLNERIRLFWQERAGGWAPRKAATMLENSRLDRLVSLSHNLRLWTQPCSDAEDEGRLILAWANLGILVEGTMTWFLCVWEDAYARNPMQSRKGYDLDANRLTLRGDGPVLPAAHLG